MLKTINSLTGKFGYVMQKKSLDDKLIEDECGQILRKCQEFTMTSKERMYSLYKTVEYLVKADVSGDFVECGVWRGGSAMLMALALLKLGKKDRVIYLYDTFEGMSEPSKEDFISPKEKGYTKNMWLKNQQKDHNNWCFASLDEVKNNILSTGYPEHKIICVKGKAEETIPKTLPSQIALLRLDTDFYESTKQELTFLYPLLRNKGVLIIDDYGHWAGARKAVDEYFTSQKITILLNRIDETGRSGIKL